MRQTGALSGRPGINIVVLDTGRVTGRVRLALSQFVSRMQWQPSGRLLMMLIDGTLINVTTSGTRIPIRQPPAKTLAVDPTGRFAIVPAASGALAVYDLSNGQMLRTIKPMAGALRSATFSANGSALAVSGRDRTAVIGHPERAGDRLVDVAASLAAKPGQSLPLDLIGGALLSPNGAVLATLNRLARARSHSC